MAKDEADPGAVDLVVKKLESVGFWYDQLLSESLGRRTWAWARRH